jgi:hypothetical protein
MRSPSWTNTHQSGFPQIRQGLRLLTRQKTFEIDVGMAPLPAALFFNREPLVIRFDILQYAKPAH